MVYPIRPLVQVKGCTVIAGIRGRDPIPARRYRSNRSDDQCNLADGIAAVQQLVGTPHVGERHFADARAP